MRHALIVCCQTTLTPPPDGARHALDMCDDCGAGIWVAPWSMDGAGEAEACSVVCFDCGEGRLQEMARRSSAGEAA